MTLAEIQRKISDGELGDYLGIKKRLLWIADFIYTLFTSVQAEAIAAVVNGVKAAVTVNMTNVNADLTYTAVTYGETGNDISVVHVDPAANNAPLDVSVLGNVITISLATGAGGAITSTAAQVMEAINAHEDASLLVVAAKEGDGSGIVEAVADTPLVGGIDVTPGEIGSFKFKSDGSLLYMKVSEQVWKKASLAAL